jgi:hypothetical protein
VLKACWECQGADDLDPFERLALDSFAAVLDVTPVIGGGGGGNGEAGAETVRLVLVQFPEVTVSVTAVPNSLCHMVLRFWIGDKMAGWGLVTSPGLSKLTTILEHKII